MANYFKIIYRTGEEDWQTSEVIINEEQHTKIQEQMANGSDFIFIKDKATIKRTSVVSIASANDIVSEYQKAGVGGFELPTPERTKLPARNIGSESIKDFLGRTHGDFHKRMGWDTGNTVQKYEKACEEKRLKEEAEKLKPKPAQTPAEIEVMAFEKDEIKVEDLNF